jgi:hypothetical protein
MQGDGSRLEKERDDKIDWEEKMEGQGLGQKEG